LENLEEEGKNTKEVSNKPDHCCETESVGDGSAIKVEVKVSGKKMLIRIHCQKYDGLLVKIITEIQSYQLIVVNNRLLAFGDSFHDITIIAEVKDILFNKKTKIFFFISFSLHHLLPIWNRRVSLRPKLRN